MKFWINRVNLWDNADKTGIIGENSISNIKILNLYLSLFKIININIQSNLYGQLDDIFLDRL
ncbi:hypothetical protein BpHYR1_002931 [Brachionus plicatilis]|uniref:Uncharacterized protein n=1 Tax=Brachionus plicatilis TaxID=10195 RepID=A0A3M7RCE4_BRAPC|nr:hypothetical protein BpHYR1_002931 [Brachionus plicatilis]